MKFKLLKSINVLFFVLISAQSFSQIYIKQNPTGDATGVDWDNALGANSLRSAIVAGGSIFLAEGTYNVNALGVPDAALMPSGTSIIGGFSQSATGSSLSSYNPAVNVTTIDGQNKMILYLLSGSFTVKGIVFDNANGAGAGGTCIRALAGGGISYNWLVEDCIFKNSTNSGGGGGAVWLHGAYLPNSTVKVKNCIFDNNLAIAGSYTGALMIQNIANRTGFGEATNNGTDFVIEGCSFTNNSVTAGGGGGAMQILSSRGINLRNNTFCGNYANNDAGALLVSSSPDAVITNCSFNGNSNDGQYGPALYILSSTNSKVLNCNFSNNVGSANTTGGVSAGGGLVIASGTSHLVDNCIFINNSVTNRGGAINFQGGGSITINNCKFRGNSVTNSINAFGGGAIFASSGSSSTLVFSNNIYDNNSHVDNTGTSYNGIGGGAILVVGGASATSSNSIFSNNRYNNNASILKSDVAIFGGGTFNVVNSALQISQSLYTTFYNVSVGNSFNNTNNPNPISLSPITCPTALTPLCNAGSNAPALNNTSISNVCPNDFVDLNTLFATNVPNGTSLTWHSNTPATSSNKITALSNVTSGTFYASFEDAVNNCYSPTTGPITITINNCSAGVIDCSKTKIIPAPVVGQAGQVTLVVSINITTSGCFPPLSVNGSGMSLANSVNQVCTANTGVQEFSIPLFYDGSTLGSLSISIGNTGSCTLDLTKAPVKACIDIWTDDCVPTAAPKLN